MNASKITTLVVLLLAAGCPDSGQERNCTDGIDNDNNGSTDCDDTQCMGDPACAGDSEICNDTVDNDGDGLIDCDDPGCLSAAECDPSGQDGGLSDGGHDDGGPGDGGGGFDAGGAVPLDEDPAGDLDPGAGHPALDIVRSGVFQTPSGDALWFRVTFADGWRPPSTLFSWFARVQIDGDRESAAVVTQHHDGEDLTFTEGSPDIVATFRDEPMGFRVQVMLPVGFTPMTYRISSGVLRTTDGTLVQDFTLPFSAIDALTYPFIL
jgi:hypothetical protein